MSEVTLKDESWQYDERVSARVPEEHTHGWANFLMIFIGMWTALVALGGGITLGTQMSASTASLGLLAGYIVCMIYGYFVGLVGVKERLCLYNLLGRPFSTLGMTLPSIFVFLIAGTFIGVQADGVTRVIMTVAHVKEFSIIGPITNWGLISAVLCAIMMISAYKGIKYIGLVSWISMPIYIIFLAVVTILSVKAYSGGLGAIWGATRENTATFSDAMFMGVSLYAGFTGMMPDVSRFVKTKKDFTIAIVVGYLIASLIPISGVIMGAAFPGLEYWEIFGMFGPAMGIFACIALFFTQWTTNDNNAFSSGLALANATEGLNPKIPAIPVLTRTKATIVPIIMGVVFAGLGAGATAPLLNAVSALGSWLPPMSGVFLGHFYIVERGGKQVYAKGLAALLSWIIVSILVHTGKLPLPAISGVIGGLILYVILYYVVELPLLGTRKETQAASAS
jgi:cytosine permease